MPACTRPLAATRSPHQIGDGSHPAGTASTTSPAPAQPTITSGTSSSSACSNGCWTCSTRTDQPPPWFTNVTPHLLGRAISIRLAQITTGGPAANAGMLLGIPRSAAHYAATDVPRQLGRRQRAFDKAIDALAHNLHTAAALTNYGRRRDALRGWTISPDQWQELINGLPGRPVDGRFHPNTHWNDDKRTLAAVWVWVRITGGEHIYAAPVRPDPNAPRPGGYHARYVHARWPFIRDGRRGHYAALRPRLDAFADRLAVDIDTRPQTWTQESTAIRKHGAVVGQAEPSKTLPTRART
jgi:hypothetical protein